MSTHIWRATDYESVIQSSRTKPMIVWCEDTDGHEPPQRFLVKSPGHPETLESNLFAELFGILLARDFGILTPRPALVELTVPFVRTVQPVLSVEAPQIQLRPGYGVDAGYMAPLQPLLSNFSLPTALLSQFALLYAFDLLVANPDRRIGNPNCALQSTNLIAYDFEQSFSFFIRPCSL